MSFASEWASIFLHPCDPKGRTKPPIAAETISGIGSIAVVSGTGLQHAHQLAARREQPFTTGDQQPIAHGQPPDNACMTKMERGTP